MPLSRYSVRGFIFSKKDLKCSSYMFQKHCVVFILITHQQKSILLVHISLLLRNVSDLKTSVSVFQDILAFEGVLKSKNENFFVFWDKPLISCNEVCSWTYTLRTLLQLVGPFRTIGLAYSCQINITFRNNVLV